jgi:hypothetical protein
MYNTDLEKNVLVDSLSKSDDPKGVLESLRYIQKNKTPFSLYIATLDRTNCMWIFDSSTVYDMLGGKDIHDKIFRKIFDEDERESGILFYIFQKTAPVTAIRLSLDFITELIEMLELRFLST